MRLDQYLHINCNINSRSRAELIIKKGLVRVNGDIITKPSYYVSDGDVVNIESDLKYSSQGGYKLETAIKHFNIDVTDKICIDIGASNGGFTHCLLLGGALKVYAVDVGENALPEFLSNDNRVIVKEKLNARYITFQDIGEKADIITIDVSYISLKLIIPAMINLLKQDGIIIVLIKPQFEAGRENIPKSGIINDVRIHNEIIESLRDSVKDYGLTMSETIAYIPFEKNKNTEYLAVIRIID